MIPSGPRALSVCAVTLLAAKPKLAVVLLRLLHFPLAGRCATPREPRPLLVFSVHMALITVGALLLLASPMHPLYRQRDISEGHIGVTIASGECTAAIHRTMAHISQCISFVLRCAIGYQDIA